MSPLAPTLEVERIMNLARQFDWKKVTETVTDTEITLTISKKIDVEPTRKPE